MSIGNHTRKIDHAALARALAAAPKPHRRSHAGQPIAAGASLAPLPKGKWPSPQYALRRALKAARRPVILGIDLGREHPRGPTLARRLIESWYTAGDIARAVQQKAQELRRRQKLERRSKGDERKGAAE